MARCSTTDRQTDIVLLCIIILLLLQSRYIGPENLFSRITDEKEAARIDKKYHRKHIFKIYFNSFSDKRGGGVCTMPSET